MKSGRGLSGLFSLVLAGCQAGGTPLAPLAAVPRVDIDRFMGDWYVIASIPTFIEKDAYNAVESYELDDDGSIAVTFTFREGGFNGKQKRYTPRGFVTDDPSNAVWRMQFLWPFKADYQITYLADDYGQTIVSRSKRDYVWIMARTPTIPPAEYERLLAIVSEQGYDRAVVRKVPQQW